MNTSLILRAALLGFVVLVMVAGWNAVKNENDGLKLIFFIFVGAGCGIWAIKVILPRLGDALGTFVYSSGEEIESDDRQKAAARIAQGDFSGAIEEYEKLAENEPEDPHPVSEIARIRSHFLHDPVSAFQLLDRKLKEHPWPEEAEVFLRFRMADILTEDLNDNQTANQVLEQVVADFPNTRHSAKARHRIHEVNQSKNQQMVGRRKNAGERI